MMRLGPIVLVAVLQIPPASIYDDDEAGAGCLGSSAPDTASENYDNDEAATGGLGSSAPDAASNIGL